MNTRRMVSEICLCYIFSTCTHWFITNAYATICTPPSFSGLVKSALLTQSPTCQILNSANSFSVYLMNQAVTTTLSLMLIRISTRYKTQINA